MAYSALGARVRLTSDGEQLLFPEPDFEYVLGRGRVNKHFFVGGRRVASSARNYWPAPSATSSPLFAWRGPEIPLPPGWVLLVLWGCGFAGLVAVAIRPRRSQTSFQSTPCGGDACASAPPTPPQFDVRGPGSQSEASAPSIPFPFILGGTLPQVGRVLGALAGTAAVVSGGIILFPAEIGDEPPIPPNLVDSDEPLDLTETVGVPDNTIPGVPDPEPGPPSDSSLMLRLTFIAARIAQLLTGQ